MRCKKWNAFDSKVRSYLLGNDRMRNPSVREASVCIAIGKASSLKS